MLVNFLAHFHLAWPDDMLVVGGLEGDYYKGLLPGQLPPQLLAGVKLHRAIDAYTDQHEIVAELRRGFPPPLRRYAGILIDLCFDYFLSRQWHRHNSISLQDFSSEVYGQLQRNNQLLSASAASMAERLVSYDLLNRYQHWDTIAASASRIGERLRGDNPLQTAGDALVPLLPELERGFEVFYPELMRFARHTDTTML